MSKARTKRSQKRQRGQFMTPRPLAHRLISDIKFNKDDRVLEPGFGEGSFLIPIIEAFVKLYEGPISERISQVLNRNIWGIEIDPVMYQKTLEEITERVGTLPSSHNLKRGDFLEEAYSEGGLRVDTNTGSLTNRMEFTHIIGNPPFGGTIASHLQDPLEKRLGWRHGLKIKKETYSWFIIKSLDLLAENGLLRFICSNTFLTISTMKGLRNALLLEGQPIVQSLSNFSDETDYPMVVLDWWKTGPSDDVIMDDSYISVDDISLTAHLSWGLTPDLSPYFRGPTLGDFMIATSGMTTGNNALFIRKVENGTLKEPYEFVFADVPITLSCERERARLGYLSSSRIRDIKRLEAQEATRRELFPVELPEPLEIKVPHDNYAPYNKAAKGLVYQPPTHFIYWKDNGDAVLTYKKTGNWYLNGVGGAPYFGKEGLTWRLISPTLDVRYLPKGYILDSGAPCAFPRPGVSYDDMLFIMGWALTDKCTQILKKVINHTLNIQSKDFERLPFPYWVDSTRRAEATALVKDMIDAGMKGRTFTRQDPEIRALESIYKMAVS